jgi:hypothetical protein
VKVPDYEMAGLSRQIFPVSFLRQGKSGDALERVEQRVVSVDYSRSMPQGLRSVGGSQSYARGCSPA